MSEDVDAYLLSRFDGVGISLLERLQKICRPYECELHPIEMNALGLFLFEASERNKGNSTTKAKNLGKMFDDGERRDPHLDFSRACRPSHEQKRWIVESLNA